MTTDTRRAPETSFMRPHTPTHLRGRVLDLGEAYWRSRSTDGLLPARRDIEPAEIKSLLPHVVLLDVRREPWDFRFRLIGTTIVPHMNAEHTGKWMSEIEHMRAPSRIFDACVTVATTGEPLRGAMSYAGPHRGYVRMEELILPLAADGVTPDILMVFLEYFPRG